MAHPHVCAAPTRSAAPSAPSAVEPRHRAANAHGGRFASALRRDDRTDPPAARADARATAAAPTCTSARVLAGGTATADASTRARLADDASRLGTARAAARGADANCDAAEAAGSDASATLDAATSPAMPATAGPAAEQGPASSTAGVGASPAEATPAIVAPTGPLSTPAAVAERRAAAAVDARTPSRAVVEVPNSVRVELTTSATGAGVAVVHAVAAVDAAPLLRDLDARGWRSVSRRLTLRGDEAAPEGHGRSAHDGQLGGGRGRVGSGRV